MDKVYLLHAHAQCGKDTCAQIMKEEYEKRSKRVIIIAFADYVKFTLEKYYGITDFKSPEGRSRIQHYATEEVRSKSPTFWMDVVGKFLWVVEKDFDVAIIPDWRFKNEADLNWWFDDISVIKVCIERPNYKKIDNMTEEQRFHSSERNLDNYQNFDYNIINVENELENTKAQLVAMIEGEENEENR